MTELRIDLAAHVAATQTTYLRSLAQQGVRALLELAGEDPDRPGLVDTPRRMVAAFEEMTSRPGNPAELLSRTFPDIEPERGATINVAPIPYVSVCEHHLLPFTGHVWIGYQPRAKVVGLSKIPRLVAHYACRPQVQERLTSQIAAAMVDHLDPDGVAVRVSGMHACMASRGVRASGAEMVTAALRGSLATEPHRGEFLALCGPLSTPRGV